MNKEDFVHQLFLDLMYQYDWMDYSEALATATDKWENLGKEAQEEDFYLEGFGHERFN